MPACSPGAGAGRLFPFRPQKPQSFARREPSSFIPMVWATRVSRGIPPRKLRASFHDHGFSPWCAQDRVLKAYVGHAPLDILGRHYRKIVVEELKAVSNLMNDWRSLAEEVEEKTADHPSY